MLSPETCISVPHYRGKYFCFPSHEKKNILTEEGAEKNFTSTMKFPSHPTPDKKMVVALVDKKKKNSIEIDAHVSHLHFHVFLKYNLQKKMSSLLYK